MLELETGCVKYCGEPVVFYRVNDAVAISRCPKVRAGDDGMTTIELYGPDIAFICNTAGTNVCPYTPIYEATLGISARLK